MKLFKSLRQIFIKEGDIKRYFLYAIGEIFLVMIGISLAFQLNNWNDNRLKESIEISYYKNIRDQISDDKMLVESQLKFNNRFLIQFKFLNEQIELNNREHLDSLGLIVRDLTQYSDFDKKGNIYETMVNSGEIKLLRNHRIVNGIRELEEKYNYMNRMENIHYEAIMNHAISSTKTMVKFSDGTVQKPEQLFSYEFQNLVLSLIQIMTEKDKVYNEVLNEIVKTTLLIDNELNH
ncbi:DUF6090 family protein [Winogradskyella sp.]|uniref:DUF6090 family protein n=1 Tax=Winogradskyella sp. TaxID=1883156 RepID=UPI0025F4B06F|nr:DUF6090 family protein [Winogradskyella sp.]